MADLNVTLWVLGIDPGGTTGLARLWRTPSGYGFDLHQVKALDPDGMVEVIRAYQEGAQRASTEQQSYRVVVACEDFVVGNRAARSSHRQGGQRARDLIGAIRSAPVPAVFRTASTVKTWATDRRMALLGADFTGKPHAKDAARHALYAAVRDLHWPDPIALAGQGVDGNAPGLPRKALISGEPPWLVELPARLASPDSPR